ncbi:MAG TPA: PilZ domain-containing protein [Candidatus Methylomirabilis sp.]|jgi:uncharacterized protein (TIGR02266 family)|nr:PilZ domain-containing protein [Candidatus Methylomirabilis sp.]
MGRRGDRRYPRIEVYLPARCTVLAPGMPETRLEGKTRQVSFGGAMLLLRTPLPVQTQLLVRLGDGPELRSRVVWIGKASRTDLGSVFGHGIAFAGDLEGPALQIMLKNRRQQRHRRLPARFQVAYDHGETSGTGTCLNLSQGGMFIHTLAPVRPGQDLRLRLTPPEPLSSFSLPGQVIWNNPVKSVSDFAAGMGVRFAELGPIEVEQLATLGDALRGGSAHPGKAPLLTR